MKAVLFGKNKINTILIEVMIATFVISGTNNCSTTKEAQSPDPSFYTGMATSQPSKYKQRKINKPVTSSTTKKKPAPTNTAAQDDQTEVYSLYYNDAEIDQDLLQIGNTVRHTQSLDVP